MTTDPNFLLLGRTFQDRRTRSVGCAVRRPYSDSDESDNDVLYADEHDSTVQQVSLRNNWLTATAVDSCGERWAQLDDFNWFLPTNERAGDLPAPESEIEVSNSESEVEYIEPDSIPLQMEMMARQLLCPPVVAQTRPMEGCDPALPQRLRWGRDVLTEDSAVAVDIDRVSAASDAVVSRETHRIQNVSRQLCLSWLRRLRPPPRSFSRDLQTARTYSRRWASV